jgi:transposase-like protein
MPDNNPVEQDHRAVKLRIGPMLGFERFRTAVIAITGMGLLLNLARLRLKDGNMPALRNAVSAA